MTRADYLFIADCEKILDSQYSDEGLSIRPKWHDGTPAHTRKQFGVTNYYYVGEEFPILTLRKINWQLALREIFWIYQKATPKISELGGHIWDDWDVGDGTIGKAYGYQIGLKTKYPEGEFNQMEKVLYDLEHNPASRSIMTNTYNIQDLPEMGLRPCAYGVNWSTYHDPKTGKWILNMVLLQRSQDHLTANNWNVCQYALLQCIVAKCVGMEVGEMLHVITDCHIYDRHEEIVKDMVRRAHETPNSYDAPKFLLTESEKFQAATNAIERWKAVDVEDIELVGYQFDTTSYKIEVAV